MEEKHWIININQVLNKLPVDAVASERWRKRSIYKIPASITDLNERAYKPQIVSIGPYHHGADHLKAMEEQKHRALSHFLKRSNKSLKNLVDDLTPVVQRVKDAYDQLDSKWHQDTDKFLEMMILDGCFILEILRTSNKKMLQNDGADDYTDNDPIFSYHAKLYVFRNLRYDMLMLENQIPMLVLEKLASDQNEDQSQKDHGLTTLILNFFSQGKASRHPDTFRGCLHILDGHRKSLVLEEPPQHTSLPEMSQRKRFRYVRLIQSVEYFQDAGILIKPSESGSLQDITFRVRDPHGVLKLPVIVVDDALESLFLNLMAFERFHVGAGNEVTSYVYFMNNIITDAMDVTVLASRGIIDNVLGSDMAAANLFESLSREATFNPDSRLAKVHMEVSAFCQRPWPRWWAQLRRNYFNTPYALTTFIVTIILLYLTVAQTVFSVLSYYK